MRLESIVHGDRHLPVWSPLSSTSFGDNLQRIATSDGNGKGTRRDSFEQIASFVGPWISSINGIFALIRFSVRNISFPQCKIS